MTTIRLICVLGLAAGLIAAGAGCERHSYEETSKLQHHGGHGEEAGHGDEGAASHEGAKSGGTKGEKEGAAPAEEKPASGRKVF